MKYGWIKHLLRKNSAGADFGPRRRLNVIEGTNVTLTLADDPDNDEIDLTIASSAGATDHGTLTGLTDDDHTQYRLESADHTHQSTGLQAGTLDHGLALTGLTDDDHTQYRLESADHTHQSTGAQAGTLDHGLALTGLTDDDHTQYLLESVLTTKGDIYVATAASTVTRLAVGTNDQVLTADSAEATGVKWAAAGGASSPVMKVSTGHEAAGRFTIDLVNGGTNAFTINGNSMDTSATATSGVRLLWRPTLAALTSFAGSPVWSSAINISALGTDVHAYWGLGDAASTGSDIGFTFQHAGFKLVRAASGTASFFATQADGTTENASAALFTLASGTNYDLIVKKNGTTSTDYYTRTGSGALSAATNLTSNMPSDTALGRAGISISNRGVATQTVALCAGQSYER